MPTHQILQGDCLASLKMLPDNSVDCCVTSPPYFGLRDYGTATWLGGDTSCDHQTSRSRGDDIKAGDKQATSGGSRPNKQWECKCGAKRVDMQIGLEETPEQFVAKLVEVFREIRRILKPDGTCWVNMGDSYFNKQNNNRNNSSGALGKTPGIRGGGEYKTQKRSPGNTGCKEKDLIGIPWMLAFALRADGWYLRQDIIWAKPNPMPEPVTDRCTKSHEHIFLLSKSPKYHFDNKAILEPWKQNPRDIKRAVEKHPCYEGKHNEGYAGNVRVQPVGDPSKGKNKRDVWTVPTHAYKGAHFATFPPNLIKPCILAGCRPGGVVIDPFGGSGTTAQVAIENGRNAILCELNPDYIRIINERLSKIHPSLNL